MSKNAVLIIVLVVLLALSAYLLISNIDLKNTVNQFDKLKDKEVDIKLGKEKMRLEKAMDEKYRTDKISYEAMAKMLELEKKKVSELEAKSKKSTK